ncbi:MAG: hypothetical protein IKV83_05325 [Muribaculaceae bacterium]|nr:hypothetical protein [Muribaculaceae bacterium]
MNNNYDINQIKSLLEAYYDGTTTIEQEKLLCDFFASATEIPKEFESDRQLFMSLQTAGNCDLSIPNNLESQLISHIDNLEKAEQINRRKWIKPIIYISAAACAILLFTIGLKTFNPDNNQINQEIILVSDAKISDSINSESNPNPEIEITEPTKVEETTVPKAKKKRERTKRQRIVKQNDLNSISDEQLAYENTERALMLLSEKLKIAQEGVKQTENTIHEVNNTITDII